MSEYTLDQKGRPKLTARLPILKERLAELATRFEDWPWIDVSYRGERAERICVRAFAVRGQNAGRPTAEYFGWCFRPNGNSWPKHGGDAPRYMGWDWIDNFNRDKTALDYLHASGLWGPWAEDYDPVVVESLEEFI